MRCARMTISRSPLFSTSRITTSAVRPGARTSWRATIRFVSRQAAAVFKHRLIQVYFPKVAGKAGSTEVDRRLAYVDTHAGRGAYDDGTPGSPTTADRRRRLPTRFHRRRLTHLVPIRRSRAASWFRGRTSLRYPILANAFRGHTVVDGNCRKPITSRPRCVGTVGQ